MVQALEVFKGRVMALNGDEAVAWAVKQSNVDVVAAYPITPQTIIVEKFSEFVADGEVHTEFVPVESEHSALSACVGAAAAGARVFTATASQGLALMWEILYVASGLRLPIVMAVVNRALSAPINIHCDHSDTMGARDSGWIQLYVEDSQEAYDTTIQAFKIAEHPDVLLPVMVNLDGFFLSHTLQNVNLLPDDVVKKFVGIRRPVKIYVPYLGREVPLALDGKTPITMGPLDLQDYYFEHKMHQVKAIENSRDVIMKVNEEYAELSGRSYGNGLVVPYGLDDTEVAIVVLGSAAGTVRYVIRRLRRRGVKIGMLRIRAFRPFPVNDVVKALKDVKVVCAMDRSLSFGALGGPLFNELRSAFYDEGSRPIILNYIYGLGGRDIPPSTVKVIVDELLNVAKTMEVKELVKYVGVRE